MMSLALLEVMDKEPPLWGVWVSMGIVGALGFWSGFRKVWPGFVVLAWQAIMALGTHEELTDPYIGPAILREAGRGYVVQTYLAVAVSMLATVVGVNLWFARWLRRRRSRVMHSAAPSEVPSQMR